MSRNRARGNDHASEQSFSISKLLFAMYTYYRVVRRKDGGSEAIAEIHGARVSGPQADMVRERLMHFGYPKVSVQTALERFRMSAPNYIGFERVDVDEI